MELTSALRTYAVVALSAAVLSPIAVAQPALRPQMPVQPATADDLEDALDLMEDTIDTMDDFNDVLNTCTDRASADAAAPKLVKIAAEMKDCVRRANALEPNLTEEEAATFMAKKPEFDKEIDEEKAEMAAHIKNLVDNNAFGSEALISALQTVSDMLGD